MGTPYMCEIRIMSFNFAPKGWAMCNGQLLPIAQNQALFSLLGTTYGGNGSTNFALPDLRGRVSMHKNTNSGGHSQGERAGEQAHTVTISELPTHTHMAQALAETVAATTANTVPTGKALAQGNASLQGNQTATVNIYGQPASPLGTLAPTAVSNVGGSQPHENRQPYLALNFCIALQGFFPDHS